MTVDLDLLEFLMNPENIESCKFTLWLNERNYVLENVSISNSATPVNTPTTRGGVYFSEKFAYKLKGTVFDLSIVPLLTKTMLGPNTEFREIKISTLIKTNDKNKKITLHANLTNSVQGPSKIELHMIITKLNFY